MRASIIVASHNEGPSLVRTLDSCVQDAAGMDVEIVVVDDCSTDGSIEAAVHRNPTVVVRRTPSRCGASPPKALWAQAARGHTLLFLDAHSKPESGSLERLLSSVEATGGEQS